MREFRQVGVQLRAAIVIGQPADGRFAIPPVLGSIDAQLDPRIANGGWPDTWNQLVEILHALEDQGCTNMRVLYPQLS